MVKGTLKIVQGDATSPQTTQDDEVVIIPHCCNNLKGWGKGFVLALSAKDKTPEVAYRSMFNSIPAPNNARSMLGRVSFATFGNASYYEYGNETKRCKSKIFVANMIAQNGVRGNTDSDIPLRYVALIKCMQQVAEWIIGKRESDKRNGICSNYAIHAPKFGSDLAMGNWDFILELIREIWLEAGIDVTVYEFKK